MTRFSKGAFYKSTLSAAALSLMAAPVLADQVFNDDVIVTFSLCVGNDCVNGESFGFDTIRLKENNTRIKFQDTSNSASFPSNDWELTANDSSNGGSSYLAITDVTAGRVPFRVEAGAQANTLVVESDGDIGIKTLQPVVDLHVVEGNSPTLRLEQDGSDGFSAQTWDMAGNEANFFIRDVTNGSQLPFRIQPGADTDALYIANDNDIGMGTDSPQAKLDVRGEAIMVQNNGRVSVTLSDTSDAGPDFRTQLSAGSARFSYVGSGVIEMELEQNGDLKIAGNYISSGTTLTVPDYVFAEDYALRPLAEVQSFIDANSHLPEVPSAAQIAADGLDMSEMQMTLLKKVEELTLYTLAQEAKLAEVATLKAEVAALKAQLVGSAADRD